MKTVFRFLLIAFLILLSLQTLSAQDKSNEPLLPRVSIDVYFNYATLDQVFELFKSKYNIKIEYDKADIPKDFKFSYSYSFNQAAQAIEIALRGTSLGYTISHDGVVLIFDTRKQQAAKESAEKTRYSGAATRHHFTLSGSVKDKKTGEPLPFVNLVLAQTGKGVATNVDGYFTLVGIPNDTTFLEISYIGYKNKTVFLSPKTPLNSFLIELESQEMLMDEVTISTDREELLRASEKISMLKLSPSKIAALPSVGEKDIMRSFQLMPGVSAANENSSGLYVRGGTPDQTLVLYDGFNVYHVEHLFGFFSAFNPNAIKDVQLYKGGFESKFGGRVGSVAEITGKEGNSKEFNMGIDAGFLAFNTFVEVPIGNQFTSMITKN